MNPKYWIFASMLSLACIDSKPDDDDDDDSSGPSDESDTDTDTDTDSDTDADPPADPAYFTSSWAGEATVEQGTSYTGWETLENGESDTAGVTNCLIYWTMSGTAIELPAECEDCQFAFEMTGTYSSADSVDDGSVDGCLSSAGDATFSYAYGNDEYGDATLFYLSSQYGWGPFITDGDLFELSNGSTQDLNGVEHASVATFDGTTFTYKSGYVDFYYQP